MITMYEESKIIFEITGLIVSLGSVSPGHGELPSVFESGLHNIPVQEPGAVAGDTKNHILANCPSLFCMDHRLSVQ